MRMTVTIECGSSDFATLAAMLQIASNGGIESVVAAQPAPVAVTAAPAPVAQPAPVAIPPLPVTEDNGDDASEPIATVPSADSAGMPWDERIHSGAKSTNADGTWRRRKGVSPADVARIEAELRGDSPPLPLSAPVAPVTPPPPTQTPAAPAMPSAAPAPVAQPAPNVGAQPTFFDAMGRVSSLVQSGRATTNDVAQLCVVLTQRMGKTINSLTELINDSKGVTALVELMRERQMWDA